MNGASGPAPHTLRQYALLADGERGALIGPDGAVVWLCFPTWHCDAVFSALIGGAGHYAISPVGRFVWGGYYEPGSLVWRSRWVGEGAIVECREALAAPAQRECAVVLRRVVVHEGSARMRIVLDPHGGYGTEALRGLQRSEDGCWTGALGGVHLRWSGAGDAQVRPPGDGSSGLGAELTLGAGEHHDFVLELNTTAHDGPPPDADASWAATEDHWRRTVPELRDVAAARDARHAYAVLAGMTGATGGTVAAVTTSLPERSDAGRNYDYRYVWIRDQCFVGQAVAAAGPYPLLDDAVRFVTARLLADGPRLMPAYTVDGDAVPRERTLGLPGYPGGDDIVGNHVNDQFQLDAFGEALLLFAAAARHGRLDVDGWRAAEAAIDAITRRRHDPDAGIWELHDDHWAHSGLQCAAGLRAIAAAPGAPPGPASAWTTLADAIVLDVSRRCVHPSGRWQRAPQDDRVDAALLLPTIRGAVPSGDPRAVATLAAVRRELTEDGYVYRFRHDERPLGDAEGAFVLCGFWLALAQLQRGDVVEAVHWFERNRAGCGPPGLFSEEFDVRQRQLRGNLPQAFVHAGLLECAARLGTSRAAGGSAVAPG